MHLPYFFHANEIFFIAMIRNGNFQNNMQWRWYFITRLIRIIKTCKADTRYCYLTNWIYVNWKQTRLMFEKNLKSPKTDVWDNSNFQNRMMRYLCTILQLFSFINNSLFLMTPNWNKISQNHKLRNMFLI